MAENNVDFAHFKYVHGTDAIPDDDLVVDGTYKRTVANDGSFVREGFGLGLGVLRIAGYMAHSIVPRLQLTLKTSRFDRSFSRLPQRTVRRRGRRPMVFRRGYFQDFCRDLENKRYVERPVLTKSEKALLEQRQWVKQFYSNPDS